MTPGAIAEGILLLGPGFVFWKTLYLSGAQHRRPEWEWIVWSVLTSLLIAWLTTTARAFGANWLSAPAGWADTIEVLGRFALAGLGGFIAGRIWLRVRRSTSPRWQKLQRSVRDSAWDLVLEQASMKDRGVVLYVPCEDADDKERAYYGRLHAFGYEAADVEPWLYLTHVQVWDEAEAKHRDYDPGKTVGILIHQSQVKRIRITSSPSDDDTAPAELAEAAGQTDRQTDS